jgi:hypothetical protein
MSNTIWRRRIAVAGAVALTALVVGGCAKKNQAGTNPPSAGVGQIGASPTAAGTATGGAGATTAPPPASPAGPSYPTDPRGYAQALLRAWANKDYTRLGQLAAPSAVQQIKDSINFTGLPNSNWHYIRCEGAAGSQYCTFRNDNGDETVIRLISSQIGHPMAVTEAPLERTQFPTTAGAYIGAFMDAWQKGNQQRMLAYSTQTVLGYATSNQVISSFNLGCDGAAGSTYVSVYGLGTDLGRSYAFQVNNDSVSAGKKHAIVNTATPQASPPC